jgi:serine/threonine protein kinase
MSRLAVNTFLKYVESSGLVEAGLFHNSLAALRVLYEGELPDDAEAVAQHFMEAKLLTRWQVEQIFDHKYTGFFLGKYKLLRQISAGPTCNVFLAEHVLMRRQVAVKILPQERVQDLSQLALFHLEILATTFLSQHPRFVRGVDADYAFGQYFLITEYLVGENLEQVVAEQGPLPIGLACRYVIQAADTLAYAHDNQFVHGNVQPANLILDSQESIAVCDLGLALFPGAARRSLVTAHQQKCLRSAKYASPEQRFDSCQVDLRTDIYSLGCTFYFLLTGRSPLTVGWQENARQPMTTGEGVRKYRPECPRDLAAICARMRSLRPEKRYQSMRDVRQAMEDWLREHGYPLQDWDGSVDRQLAKLRIGTGKSNLSSSALSRLEVAKDSVTPTSSPGRHIGMGIAIIALTLGWLVDRNQLISAWKNSQNSQERSQNTKSTDHPHLNLKEIGEYISNDSSDSRQSSPAEFLPFGTPPVAADGKPISAFPPWSDSVSD